MRWRNRDINLVTRTVVYEPYMLMPFLYERKRAQQQKKSNKDIRICKYVQKSNLNLSAKKTKKEKKEREISRVVFSTFSWRHKVHSIFERHKQSALRFY